MSDNGNPRAPNVASLHVPTRNHAEGGEWVRVPITSDRDIITARQRGKELATRLGFSTIDLTLIATAISELSRNIVIYAKTGEIVMKPVRQAGRKGIQVVARDDGPGIPDIPRALEDGFSTSRSLGLGLPGVRRLMDSFDLVSKVNQGTTVTVAKWIIPTGD